MPINGLSNLQNLQSALGKPKAGLDAVPQNADASALKNLLSANLARINKGSRAMISGAEASWLTSIAAHPAADKSVAKAIVDQVGQTPLSSTAKRAGFDNLLQELKQSQSTQGTPNTNDTFGGTTNTTVDAPTDTNVGGGNAVSVRIDQNSEPAIKTNPVDFAGALTFEGPYRISAQALNNSYNGVGHDAFGTTTVQLPGTQTTVTRVDMAYDLGDGKVGMNLIPVSDSGTIKDADGNDRSGNAIMDEFLRKEMGLKPEDPIYTLIAYVHPEEHTGDLSKLTGQMVKTEMGATHIGSYIGNGNTTNSPEDYHGKQWEVQGYPANVQVVSLEGVNQGLLNKNAILADSILNDDVQFPSDYKNDKFRTIDLNTTLQFYKDWVNDEAYLKNDPSWHTYCAEHKTIVTNIMLNVPHNEASFKEVFGDQEGAKTWKAFKEKFKGLKGRPFTAADETSFEPLWKKEGLKASDIKPLSKSEYDAYDAARHGGNLASFTGTRPLAPGVGMAWAPETSADLVNDFVDTYTPTKAVGGIVASTVLLGFKDTIVDRMGISDAEFITNSMPVINKMMVADAMMNATDPSYAKMTFARLYVAYGGDAADLGGNLNPQIKGLAEGALQGVKKELGNILTNDALQSAPFAKRVEMADAFLQKAVKSDMKKARALAVSDPSKTQFYSPPAVSHRVSIGMHESSRFVSVKTVATAVDASEVESV